MTRPYERRRAIEWAGEMLRDIQMASKDEANWGGPVPEKLRALAVRILRHYPQPSQIKAAATMDAVPVSDWIGPEPEQ